ncbi:hypothetical protein, variant [Aphanomyces invadans]|uniref:Uncharacterized protein n=1 Tax=Aphanomyces invadans TaxID=157072 RepID=A0A024USV3_9STRA|nr:hypothetical protein, variant [Aphanomyces invadans]ETW09606.1 hypothetical protein, variant [Aphanomyces invadans]|eukprot:XP_008861017.1 hypothetical protein, variant [Aphanomyces invadans]
MLESISFTHQAYSKLGSVQRTVQCELEGLRKMLQLQEQAAATLGTPPAPPMLPLGPHANAVDNQDWDVIQEPTTARCEAMLQQAERSADVLYETLEFESKELAHVRETMDMKWRDIARTLADEIRQLKKVVADKDTVVEQLRQELRHTHQLALAHEEDLVTRSNATLRRNEELQKLSASAHETNQMLMAQVQTLRQTLETQRATASEQRDKDEEWQGMLAEQNRQLQIQLSHESQAKAELQAMLASVIQQHAPPPPPTAVRAITVSAPKPHKHFPSVITASTPHLLPRLAGGPAGASSGAAKPIPSSTASCVPLWK